MRCLGALLSLGLCLAATASLAEPDVFELGNGQHGALRVQQMDAVINLSTALTAPASASARGLTVADTTGFAAGELVLILQNYAAGPIPDESAPSGNEQAPVDVGRWELARLESVAPGQLNLTGPLASSYFIPGAQVVRVPEYTSVHVDPNASLVAPPWDGSSGGVLAFLSTGAVLNQGLISADGAGFRGGTFAVSPSPSTGCIDLNQSQDTGGAQKGEGIFSGVAGAPAHGYGALGNGAGGGNCDDGGGGGGGHGGAGGKGGYTSSVDGSRDVGGRGGLILRYSPLTRLLFGGGGGAGAGYGAGPSGSQGSSGGAGGGLIYIRAQALQGTQGLISANGQSAADARNDGAGGGGAGGHITIRVQDTIECASLEAQGGNGGNNLDSMAHGPGGGGGGGVVLLQGATLSCTPSTLPGLGGTVSAAAGGSSYGTMPTATTQPESQGVTTSLNEAFASPSVPLWVSPAEGESTGARPQLQGTAQPGSTVQVFLNNQFLGSAEAATDGSFSLQPSADLAAGSYQLLAVADRLGLRSGQSEPRAFTVGPLSPVALQVGCGCDTTQASGGVWLALLGLVLAVSRIRPRAPQVAGAPLAEQGRPGVHHASGASAGLPGSRRTAGRAGRAGG